jgi:hypothetical protein
VYAVPPHTPLLHTSLLVHAFPSLHAVPLLTLLNAVVDTEGWQLWHAFAGFTVPEG